MSPPEPGDVIRLDVTDQPYGPDALGRHEGLAVFVEGAAPGDTVEARVTRVAGRHARAKMTSILRASPDRVEPPCSLAGRCGGCQWQHLAYPRQAAAKEAAVRDALERIGRFLEPPVDPIIPAEPVLACRNKAIYQVAREPDFQAGYYARESHRLVPIDRCPANLPEMDAALAAAAALLRGDSHAELAAHVTAVGARQSLGSGEVVLRLGLDGKRPARGFADALAEACANLTGVTAITGSERPVRGSAMLAEHVSDLRYPVCAASFFQGNPFMTPRLVELVVQAAALSGGELVIDAYGGAGLFSLALAEAAGSITLIESDRSATNDARRLFAEGFGHVTVRAGTVERAAQGLTAGVVVCDPPREGLSRQATAALVETGAQRVIYVSCDPAALARDAARLRDRGYALRSAKPIDMFPQTYHVEAVATFERG